jgi:hypothetical protein
VVCDVKGKSVVDTLTDLFFTTINIPFNASEPLLSHIRVHHDLLRHLPFISSPWRLSSNTTPAAGADTTHAKVVADDCACAGTSRKRPSET